MLIVLKSASSILGVWQVSLGRGHVVFGLAGDFPAIADFERAFSIIPFPIMVLMGCWSLGEWGEVTHTAHPCLWP